MSDQIFCSVKLEEKIFSGQTHSSCDTNSAEEKSLDADLTSSFRSTITDQQGKIGSSPGPFESQGFFRLPKRWECHTPRNFLRDNHIYTLGQAPYHYGLHLCFVCSDTAHSKKCKNSFSEEGRND